MSAWEQWGDWKTVRYSPEYSAAQPGQTFTVNGKSYTKTKYGFVGNAGNADSTSSSGTSSAAGGGMQSYLEQLQALQEQANAANEARYQETLGGYKDVVSSLEGMGEQAAEDIQTRYQRQAAQGEQDLVSRGLAGSTQLGAMRRGYMEDAEAEQRRLDESLRSQLAGYKTNTLNFMERKNETGPDMSSVLNYLYQYGSGTPSTTSTGTRYLSGGSKPTSRYMTTTNSNKRTTPYSVASSSSSAGNTGRWLLPTGYRRLF